MNENEVLLNEKKMLKKMSNKTSITLLFFLGLTYALAIIAKLALEKIIINNQELQDAVYLGLAFFVQFVVCAPVAIMINNRKTKLELNKYFKKPKVKKAFVLKWIVIGMGLSFTINIIFTIIFAIIQMVIDFEFSAPSFVPEQNFISIFSMTFAVMILAPLFEELIFRGSIYDNVKEFDDLLAILVMGFTFSLYHQNYAQFPSTFVLGMVSGFLVIKSKSIIPSIALHFCFNSIGGAQIFILSTLKFDVTKLADASALGGLNMEYVMDNIVAFVLIMMIGFMVLTIALVGLILFIIEMVKKREENKLKKISQLSISRQLLIFITAPITIVTIAILLSLTIINIMGLGGI